MLWYGGIYRVPEFYQHRCSNRTAPQHGNTAAVCQLWADFTGNFIHWYGDRAERGDAAQEILALGGIVNEYRINRA